MTFRALAVGVVLGFLVAVAPSCGPKVNPTQRCNTTSCPDGCCDDQDQCYLGTSPEACGTMAAHCQVCNANETCTSGQCRIVTDGGGGGGGSGGGGGAGGGAGGGTGSCSASNCAGCCKSDGSCVTVTSAQQCGKNGTVCSACGFGQTCNNAGTCTANTCATCRDGQGNCVDGGTTDNVCGSGGGLCLRCDTANGQHCSNQGVCAGGACNANNCSDGCCSSGTCVRDGGTPQCGLGGVACQTCNGSASCVNGSCTGGGTDGGGFPGLDGGFGTCDITSCATGCCVQGLGVCLPGTDDFACGTGAVNCDTCIFSFKTCDQASHTCK